MIWFNAKTYPHKNDAQLDAGTERSSQAENTIAASKPAQDCSLVSNLLASICHACPKEHGHWLGGDAMHLLIIETRVQAVVSGFEADFTSHPFRKRQRVADRAEPCQIMRNPVQ
eukprot:4796794-Prymnesium_polylepis.3